MSETSPRTAQVVLGLFICWQLWFLVSQNVLSWLTHAQTYVAVSSGTEPTQTETAVEYLAPGFTRDEGDGQVLSAAKWVAETNKPWAQLTGQLQMWGLFTGRYSRDCVFPAIIARWTDEDPGEIPWLGEEEFDWKRLLEKGDAPIEPRLILTPHEPSELTSYFRWRQMRMRRFENALHFVLVPEEGQTSEERAEAWEKSIRKHLGKHGWLFTTYLNVKRKEFESEWEGLPPPKQLILLLRRVHATPAEEAPPHWSGPFVVPLLLWKPPGPGEKGQGTYRRFDPTQRRFRSWQ